MFSETETRGKRNIIGYLAAVVAVTAVGALRLIILNGGKPVAAPFVVFYPVIAFAALIGGVGPGIVAAAISIVIVLLFLPGLPAPVNWLWLFALTPVLIYGFSRIKLLRDRGAAAARESIKLRAVVDRASDWVFLSDEQGSIEYANQTACASLGYTSGELSGRRIQELASETHLKRLDELIEKCREGTAAPAEILFARRNAAPFLVEVSCTSISTGRATVVHVAGRDVTERSAVERRLREARQWEGLGSLAGGIAHDFNNLLTSIMGNASLARESLPATHPVRELLESIETAGERSAELVRLMLATSGYRPRYREKLRVDEIFRSLAAFRTPPENIVIRAETEPVEVESDQRSVETLLSSLISNAEESYGGAGGEVLVFIHCLESPESAAPSWPPAVIAKCLKFEEGETPAGRCVRVAVEDHGCGITPEVLERAFDPFFTTRFTGRGLGLPAVRGIVRAHGGWLELLTREGQGTRVEVRLPCHATM